MPKGMGGYIGRQLGLGGVALLIAWISGGVTGNWVAGQMGATTGDVAPQVVTALLALDAVVLGFAIALLTFKIQTRGQNLWKFVSEGLMLFFMLCLGLITLRDGLVDFSSISQSLSYQSSFFAPLIIDTTTLAALFLSFSLVGPVNGSLIAKKWGGFDNPPQSPEAHLIDGEREDEIYSYNTFTSVSHVEVRIPKCAY
jgi:hypothetical protein